MPDAAARIGAVTLDNANQTLGIGAAGNVTIDAAETLVPARLLLNGATIARDEYCHTVTYWHIETARHAILLAENAPAETYLDTGNRASFDNCGVRSMLHADFFGHDANARRNLDSCRPFVVDAAQVRPIWECLAARAATLGHALPQPAMTHDPSPHLIAGERRLLPCDVAPGRYAFILPPGCGTVRLVSRAAAPCDLTPWLEDHRRLGLRLRRIRLRAGDAVSELPLDHPDLRDGWWDVERDGRIMWRWTDGDARLPIADGASVLEIEAVPPSGYILNAAAGPWNAVRRAA